LTTLRVAEEAALVFSLGALIDISNIDNLLASNVTHLPVAADAFWIAPNE
jgi:hypothetical protein